MKTWTISDFPSTIYIHLRDDFRDEFFKDIFKKFGGKRPYCRFLGLTQKTVKSYHRGYFYKNKNKYLQSFPLSLFKKTSSVMNNYLKQKIEDNVYMLKSHGRSIPVLNPKLPIKESPAFYRIIAHVIGDGSTPKNHPPYYANTSKELREQFKEDLNIFGQVRVYETKTTTTPIVCFPKVITDILSYILDIRFSYPNRIPREIFYASEECKSSFLKAIFDDEGTISTNLAISMNNLNLVNEIKSLVNDLGIETSRIITKKNKFGRDNYYFSVKSKSLELFRDKIGFSHLGKKNNLGAAINRRYRKQRTRPIESIDKEIINILRKRQVRTIELANDLQFTLGHMLFHLKRLEKETLIKRSGFKNGIIWSLS